MSTKVFESYGGDSNHRFRRPVLTFAAITPKPMGVMGSTNTRPPLVGCSKREQWWGRQRVSSPSLLDRWEDHFGDPIRTVHTMIVFVLFIKRTCIDANAAGTMTWSIKSDYDGTIGILPITLRPLGVGTAEKIDRKKVQGVGLEKRKVKSHAS